MNAVIVCNGDFPRKAYPRWVLSQADYIACCDGALRAFKRNAPAIFGSPRLPDVLIGDFDSLPKAERRAYKGKIVHVAEQEDNDQTKAMRYVLDNVPEVDEIHIIGAGGKREDHTIGNYALLMEYTRLFPLAERGVKVDMVSDWSTAFAVTDSCSFFVGQGRELSIFTPDNSLRIKSKGLMYPTDGVVFDNWWKATLNKASDDEVSLELSHPSMALVILD